MQETEKELMPAYWAPAGVMPSEAFEPVIIRAYRAAGGALAFESEALSEVSYGHQLNACQELLNRGILSRIDVIRHGTTELVGAMVGRDERQMKFMKYG